GGGPARRPRMDAKLGRFAARIKATVRKNPGRPHAAMVREFPGTAPDGAIPFPRQSAMRAPPTQAPERVMQLERIPCPFGSPQSGESPRIAATQADRESLRSTRHVLAPHTRSHT